MISNCWHQSCFVYVAGDSVDDCESF